MPRLSATAARACTNPWLGPRYPHDVFTSLEGQTESSSMCLFRRRGRGLLLAVVIRPRSRTTRVMVQLSITLNQILSVVFTDRLQCDSPAFAKRHCSRHDAMPERAIGWARSTRAALHLTLSSCSTSGSSDVPKRKGRVFERAQHVRETCLRGLNRITSGRFRLANSARKSPRPCQREMPGLADWPHCSVA